MKLNKLCSNLVQDFTEEEKVQARLNIGAADDTSLNSLSNVVQDLTYKVSNINGILELTLFSWK